MVMLAAQTPAARLKKAVTTAAKRMVQTKKRMTGVGRLVAAVKMGEFSGADGSSLWTLNTRRERFVEYDSRCREDVASTTRREKAGKERWQRWRGRSDQFISHPVRIHADCCDAASRAIIGYKYAQHPTSIPAAHPGFLVLRAETRSFPERRPKGASRRTVLHLFAADTRSAPRASTGHSKRRTGSS